MQAPDCLGPADQLAAGADHGIPLAQRGPAVHVAGVRSLAPGTARQGPPARPPVHGHRSWSRRRYRPLPCGSERHGARHRHCPTSGSSYENGTDFGYPAGQEPPVRSPRPAPVVRSTWAGPHQRLDQTMNVDALDLSKPRDRRTMPLLRASAGFQRPHPRCSSSLVGASIPQVGIRGAPNNFPPGPRSRPWPRPRLQLSKAERLSEVYCGHCRCGPLRPKVDLKLSL